MRQTPNGKERKDESLWQQKKNGASKNIHAPALEVLISASSCFVCSLRSYSPEIFFPCSRVLQGTRARF